MNQKFSITVTFAGKIGCCGKRGKGGRRVVEMGGKSRDFPNVGEGWENSQKIFPKKGIAQY